MRRTHFHFLSACLMLIALFVTSCNPGTGDDDSAKQDSILAANTPPAIPKDAVFLSGLYATSVNTPYLSFCPEMMFDTLATYWATMPGAGPDEGVMMYFNGLDNIGSMEVKFASGTGLGKITLMDVFVNGAKIGEITPQSTAFKDFKVPVNSIYLRIVETEGIKASKKERGEDAEAYQSTAKNYQSSLTVGIEQITFFDKSGKKLNVVPLKSLSGTVAASSTLDPVEAFTADFIFDSRYDFAWSEGNKDSDGPGEWVKMTFDVEQEVSKIKIWSGFHRSDVHYKSNARIKTFEFGTTGNMTKYELKDEMKPVEIALQKPLKGKEFIIRILEVYPGASYKDLVISELQLFTDWGWSVIRTNGQESRKKELFENISGSNLIKHLDRWYYEERKHSWWYPDTKASIILRSNQSFVIWTDERPEGNDVVATSIVYDGNWEVVSAGVNESKVNIFGTRWLISQGYGEYKGMGKTDRIQIFSDVLTITNDKITGQKFIEEINLK